jgi:peptide/nickel transport system permease protein
MVAIFISAIFQVAFGIGRYEQLAVPLLIVIIGLAEWPVYARTVRAAVMGEKNKEYVEAARVIGLSRRIIMFRHMLPNTLTSVLVISTIQVANAVMSEAALSFLGLGMPVTAPSLGSLIRSGFEYIFSGSWWITMFPGDSAGAAGAGHQPAGRLAQGCVESRNCTRDDVHEETRNPITPNLRVRVVIFSFSS